MMIAPPICLLCRFEIKDDDEIEFPTFRERGQSVQYMAHATCVDRVRDRLSPCGLEARAN